MASNKPKKERKPNWRHYDLATAGPVDDYLYSLLPKRDEVLAEMEDYATKHDIPIVGPAVARVLQQLALTINAKTVFELGSAIGYSTIWWAQAVGEKGRVIYTDGDSSKIDLSFPFDDRPIRSCLHHFFNATAKPSRIGRIVVKKSAEL